MKRISLVVCCLVGSTVIQNTGFAITPNTNSPSTTLGPALHLGTTNFMGDMSAYSIGAELGPKNQRLSGTLGWQAGSSARFKLSAEYLRQNLTYALFDGNTEQWVGQSAIGAAYEYYFGGLSLHPTLNFGGYLSHSGSKSLRPGVGQFINGSSYTQEYTALRRIAGANAGGVNPGFTITPWRGGSVGLDLNYDKVNYNTYFAGNHDSKGLGGTAHLNQALAENASVNLLAGRRQLFDNYQAGATLGNVAFYGSWNFGFNYNWTLGKNSLPSSTSIIVSADYFMDASTRRYPATADGIDSFMNVGDEMERNGSTSMAVQSEKQDFLAWATKPAVYMPQVLAVVDETVSCPDGQGPIALNAIIPPIQLTTLPAGINLSANFQGSNLSFSIVSITPGLISTDTINMTALGVLTFDVTQAAAADQQYTVVIQATNGCSAATSSIVIGPVPILTT